eukprot:2934980-Amphidinium_carterae.1
MQNKRIFNKIPPSGAKLPTSNLGLKHSACCAVSSAIPFPWACCGLRGTYMLQLGRLAVWCSGL